jgi:hypothetical protein
LAGVLILVLMQTTVLKLDLLTQETTINLTLLAEAVKPERKIEQPVPKVATPKLEKRVATPAIAEPVLAVPVRTSGVTMAAAVPLYTQLAPRVFSWVRSFKAC